MSWRDNPVFQRLIGENQRSPLRRSGMIAGWLAVVTLLVSSFLLYSVLHQQFQIFETWQVIFATLSVWLFGILMPLRVAYLAASLVSHDNADGASRPDTPASPSQSEARVGYILASLYNARMSLAALVGLIPFFAIGTTAYLVYFESARPFGYLVASQPPYELTLMDVVGPLIMTASLTAGMMLMNALAATLGIRLALHWRSTSPVGLITFMIIGPVVLGSLLAILVFIGPMVGGSAYSQYATFFFDLALPCVVCVLLPALLTVALLGSNIAKRKIADSDSNSH